MSIKINTKQSCSHCGSECSQTIEAYNAVFCCSGCKMVYELLNQKGLCDYYFYNEKPGISMNVVVNKNKFDYLDHEDVARKLLDYKDNNQGHINLYLPQIHCSSCLYLLENLHKLNAGVLSVRVDFVSKEAFIVFDFKVLKLSQLAWLLASIGYEPHISLSDADGKNYKKADRQMVYKLGVAGFCFANIMMMSLPEYFAGDIKIESSISQFLTYLKLALALPVVFYSGQDFFKSALKSVKANYLNIDAPIALAIAITFIRSFTDIISGTGPGYLDSLAGIIFFMLAGRLVQDQLYKKLSFDRDYKSFLPIAVTILLDHKQSFKLVEEIVPDDVLLIKDQEIIPVDGLISKGSARIDYSFVTGESEPTGVNIGEMVYAGGKQMGGNLEIIAVKSVSQTYLTNLWNRNKFRDKSKNKSFIDGLSTHFTKIVFLIAFITASYWFIIGEFQTMWLAVTSVFIIACPCALLLSSSFSFGRLMQLFGKEGLYLRHHEVAEHLSEIDHIVFDKTGTLTFPSGKNLQYTGEELDSHQSAVLRSMVANSSHPLSMTISDYLGKNNLLELESYKTHPGAGIEAWSEDCYYKVGSEAFVGPITLTEESKGSTVYIAIDNRVVGHFSIRNKYRTGLLCLFKSLNPNYDISLLSGDHSGEKNYLDTLLGKTNQTFFNQSPQQKLDYVRNLQKNDCKVLMVGDGLNDAGALKESHVGIAVSESANNFTPSADAVLNAKNLNKLPVFLKMSIQGRSIIRYTFMVSIVYNLVGIFFAVQGMLSPLIAAILMPLSSLTILLMSYVWSDISFKKILKSHQI